MIKAIGEWWGKWKDRRQSGLPAAYDELAREYGQLTARCLDSEQRSRHIDEMWVAMRNRCERVEAELELLKRSQLCDVPGLTPGEWERLALLSEECGEVVRAIGKIQRYGWESSSPFVAGGRTNRMALERELGSIRAVVNLMLDSQDLRLNAVQSWQRTKKTALENWTLYQTCSIQRPEQLAMMQSIRESVAGK